MNLIPSFEVDHTHLEPGVYVSRIDDVGGDFVTTFDIRMKRPNREPAMQPNALHTIEHIIATYLRNDPEWQDRIVYWGPMGCLTGSYLLVKGKVTSAAILPVICRAFEYLRDFEGEVPGTRIENCGNYQLHDLAMAKWEAARYVEALKHNPCLEYPR